MPFKVYTKENCQQCKDIKEYMTKNFMMYNEIVVGKDIELEEFKQQFPRAAFFPVIIDENDCRYTSVKEFKEHYNYGS